jgi:hypothetical protein
VSTGRPRSEHEHAVNPAPAVFDVDIRAAPYENEPDASGASARTGATFSQRPTMRRSEETTRYAVVFVLCALLSLCLYAPSFDNPFRQDDFVFLQHVRATPLRDVFKPSPDFAFYRPGAVALFSLEHALFGEASGAYLTFNYLIHLAATLLMLLIVWRLMGDATVAFLAAGLFVVGYGHYGKQVMWASTSGPLVAVVLSLLAVFLAISVARRITEGRRHSIAARVTLLLILLAVAPAFHEAAMLTPLLVVWLLVRLTARRRPLARAVGGASLVPLLLWFAVYSFVSTVRPAYAEAREAVLHVPSYFIRYLGLMVLPVQPSAIAGQGPAISTLIHSAVVLHVLIGAPASIALVIATIRGGYATRIFAAWLILALVPFTFVAMPPAWLELRYLYYAAIPYCAWIAVALKPLLSSRRAWLRHGARLAVVALIIATAVLTTMLERHYGTFGSR